jgi:hypothetical protein
MRLIASSVLIHRRQGHVYFVKMASIAKDIWEKNSLDEGRCSPFFTRETISEKVQRYRVRLSAVMILEQDILEKHWNSLKHKLKV